MTASFTVFVCSTFSDLSQEREGVLDAIRGLKLQHDSMEFFGARAEQPLETCLQEVRASEVLVVIAGLRYGSIVPVPDLGPRHRWDECDLWKMAHARAVAHWMLRDDEHF